MAGWALIRQPLLGSSFVLRKSTGINDDNDNEDGTGRYVVAAVLRGAAEGGFGPVPAL
jgi:hypothetical protein